MTDAEYLFKQTEIERKKAGYGDRHKKRQGGRHVRLPSDHRTKKEIEAMSGEVVKYNLNEPVKFERWKAWPVDIRKEYIQRLKDKFGMTTGMCAEMMGVSKPTIWRNLINIGIPADGAQPPKDMTEWEAFLKGSNLASEAQGVEEVKVHPEEPEAQAEAENEPQEAQETQEESKEVGLDTLTALVAALQSLKGTGAKLTIEVTL